MGSESNKPEAIVSYNELASAGRVVQLLPVHTAPYTGKNSLTVKRGPGRPRKAERMPTTTDLEYHAEMTETKARFIDADPVVNATSRLTDPMDVLRVVKLEVAKETAALHFQRIENEKHGRDTSQISTRRIDALKKIADIELEMRKLGADVINVRSEKFQRIFKLWLDTIREIAEQTMTPEQINLFFNHFETAMDGWEDKASDVLR